MNKITSIPQSLAAAFCCAALLTIFVVACVPPTPPVQTGAQAQSLLVAQTSQTTSPKATPPVARRNEQPTNNVVARPVTEPYTGDLSIFEGKDRERKLQIDRVMDILRITDGKRVADIGAGSGWFTVRAARRVGAGGEVYAVEINEDYLNYIRQRATREGLANIRPALGTADDPRLAPASVDAALLLKTYHEVQEPIALLRRVREAIRPGGRVGIIDRNGTGGNHGVQRDDVVREAESVGFRLVEEYDFVKADGEDYFLVFEPVN